MKEWSPKRVEKGKLNLVNSEGNNAENVYLPTKKTIPRMRSI